MKGCRQQFMGAYYVPISVLSICDFTSFSHLVLLGIMTLIHLPGNRGSQRGGLQVILDSSSGAHGSGSRITTAEISHWRKLSPGPSKCVAPHAAVNIPAHTSLGAVGAVPRIQPCPDRCGSVGWASSRAPRGCQYETRNQDTGPGCRLDPRQEVCRRRPADVSLSH
uniref:Uncharacterized protein n=1 Tax=Molossus molossus TaxID=27622 RepID=A0A7J8JWB5_MOLMO|nr:hypothetical protein HJG59_008117 [Molossus molossus]